MWWASGRLGSVVGLGRLGLAWRASHVCRLGAVLSVCQTAVTFTILGAFRANYRGWRTAPEFNDKSGPANFPDLEIYFRKFLE